MELWDTRPALGIISPESEDPAGVHTRLRVQTTCKHTWQDSPVRAGPGVSGTRLRRRRRQETFSSKSRRRPSALLSRDSLAGPGFPGSEGGAAALRKVLGWALHPPGARQRPCRRIPQRGLNGRRPGSRSSRPPVPNPPGPRRPRKPPAAPAVPVDAVPAPRTVSQPAPGRGTAIQHRRVFPTACLRGAGSSAPRALPASPHIQDGARASGTPGSVPQTLAAHRFLPGLKVLVQFCSEAHHIWKTISRITRLNEEKETKASLKTNKQMSSKNTRTRVQ
ncbi:uncharacterized protein [Equus przewalskii]|uniref:Uncharacterized protein n=1 Tax=Equus przewalskii TaxID=9798 RepID=A0ABM4MZH4_EQUPR